jgi:hypothetical protein
VRRAVRAGGLTLVLRDTCKELYPLFTMTSNNKDWEKGWFYLGNDGISLPPYIRNVLMGKPDAWIHDVSPPSRQRRLESLTTALRHLATPGWGRPRSSPTSITGGSSRSRRGSSASSRWRRGQPHVVGALATSTRALPQGVRGHTGEARD